jgi:glycopeptide antibiotics resistance protein
MRGDKGRNGMEGTTKANKYTRTLFIIYLIALFWIIVFKFNLPFSYMGINRSVNLIPFHAPFIINGKLHYSELLLNVVIFMPLGVYAGVLFQKWSVWRQLFLFFLVSFLCEGLQYVLGVGNSDITDIITNTLGGVLGLLICKGIERAFKNSVRAQRFINVLSTTGTVLMILLLLLLKVSNLWIFRV